MTTIALAGNPNCGKTTLFNALTGANQTVGNWPGVTVAKKEGSLQSAPHILVQDLPGIYSLSPFTPEELVTLNYLAQSPPSVIINIVDGTNLERNLFLTTQLFTLGIPIIIVVNMLDSLQGQNTELDLESLAQSFPCTVIGVSALRGEGIQELIEQVVSLTEQSPPAEQPPLILPPIPEGVRYTDDDTLAHQRYNFIAMVSQRAFTTPPLTHAHAMSDKIDSVATHRFLAIPLFLLIIWGVYTLAIGDVGGAITAWINETLLGAIITPNLVAWMQSIACDAWLVDLVSSGIIAGVGAVLGFTPQLLILFFLLALLEDCGYMARAACIMNRLFSKLGLSGKSFIPFLVASGCGVPAIMATRTIDNEQERRLTIITTAFIPCGAKMPIIALFAGAIFGGSALVAISAYLIGLAAIITSALILKKFRAFSGKVTSFIMEVPAYHAPHMPLIWRITRDRLWDFIKQAGTIILACAMVLWFLQYFSLADGSFAHATNSDQSILAYIGSAVAPLFAPLGFGDWQATVATFTGFMAKENVVSTFGVLYSTPGASGEDSSTWEHLSRDFSPLAAYSFIIFNLLCAPCFAAISAIKSEMRSTKWTWFTILYMTGFGYVVSFLVYQLGILFAGEPLGIANTFALLLLTLLIYGILRKPDSTSAP